MNTYKADFHIHTILSPCGDLFMSPANIIAKACEKGLDIIGITDHNTTRQSRLVKQLGKKEGVYVLCGAEITSKEEAHCLAYMPDIETLNKLQEYLDSHLPNIPNNVEQFGYQVQVDENEDICYEEPKLLTSAIDQSVEQIEQFVHSLNGIFIPAHVNKSRFSLTSQLGFIPPDLKYDALELSKHITHEEFLLQNSYLNNPTIIKSSDAHFVDDIGSVFSKFSMKHRSFEEIKMALNNENGREVIR